MYIAVVGLTISTEISSQHSAYTVSSQQLKNPTYVHFLLHFLIFIVFSFDLIAVDLHSYRLTLIYVIFRAQFKYLHMVSCRIVLYRTTSGYYTESNRRCSAIAERPRCRVRYSFRQKQNTGTGSQ